MAKQGWAAKLKQEVADLKEEVANKNEVIDQFLKEKNIKPKVYQTVLWAGAAFILGAIIF